MDKLIEFRTKCIKQYIREMKNYLTNWELKQEYLVNLGKEFVYDNQKVKECLDKLKSLKQDYQLV